MRCQPFVKTHDNKRSASIRALRSRNRPAAYGTGGFLLAAHDHVAGISGGGTLDRDEKKHL